MECNKADQQVCSASGKSPACCWAPETKSKHNQINDNEGLEKDLEIWYQILHSKNDPIDIRSYTQVNQGNPAFKVSYCLWLIYELATHRYKTGLYV